MAGKMGYSLVAVLVADWVDQTAAWQVELKVEMTDD